MKYLICTIADADKRIEGILTTYQVREELNDPTEEQINEALLRIAESHEHAFKRAFCFDETLTRLERWTYQFQGRQYFVDEAETINEKFVSVIR